MTSDINLWLATAVCIEALTIIALTLVNWALVSHLRFIDRMIDETDSAAVPLDYAPPHITSKDLTS